MKGFDEDREPDLRKGREGDEISPSDVSAGRSVADAAVTRDPRQGGTLPGERGEASVSRLFSVQSRASSLLAAGLMTILGTGMLAWYYAHAMARQSRAREAAQAASASRVQGDMPLPSLGRIDPPLPVVQSAARADQGLQLERSLEPAAPRWNAAAGSASSSSCPPGSAVTPAKSASQLALERRLSDTVFAPRTQPALAPGGQPDANTVARASGGPIPGSAMVPVAGASSNLFGPHENNGSAWTDSGASSMEHLLQPSDTTPAVQAQMLPTQRLLLAKGTFIDCTLETTIDSTLPGMTTCITASDIFSVDGEVVLLERGTKLVGETRGRVQQGTARVFVLWAEARTPTGVVVPLASPGADALGRSGLPGIVDRHFWDRFGAAIMISVIDGAVQAAVQSAGKGGNTVIYSPSASRDVVTEVLESTVDIPPTIVVEHGERIQVLVARDIDFRTVYALRPVATEHPRSGQ